MNKGSSLIRGSVGSQKGYKNIFLSVIGHQGLIGQRAKAKALSQIGLETTRLPSAILAEDAFHFLPLNVKGGLGTFESLLGIEKT
jgi:hypothetical protein